MFTVDPQAQATIDALRAQVAELEAKQAQPAESGADPFVGKPILDILAGHPGVNALDEAGNAPTLAVKLQRVYEHGLAVESDLLTPETARVVNSLLVKVVEGLVTKVL